MPFRKRRRQLLGKAYEKHSDTKIHVIGPATAAIPFHLMRHTEAGARDPDGPDVNIQVGRRLGEECNIGDSCKFINIHIQAGPRTVNNLESSGWIEWGFVCVKDLDPVPTKVNIGTLTLGNILTNYFRNECIMTGVLPVSANACSAQEISLKIPKGKINLRMGDQWILYLAARTVSSTETSTASFKVLTSFNYKNYH